MTDDKTNALAQPAAEQPRSLLRDLASAAGLDPQKYYATIKSLCGCQNATDEHFAALMMTAQGLGLNPIMRELYLMPAQRGVQVVVPIDGYLSFLQRAERAGIILEHEYEEAWYPDPRVDPAKKALRRGGRVTARKRGREKPIVHTEWFDEVVRDTSVWKQGQSRQLMHKTYRQFCRYHLGFNVMDQDDAERIEASTPAEVRDAAPTGPLRPSVPILSLKAPGAAQFAPVASLDAPQETAPRAGGDESEVPPVKTGGGTEPAPASPPDDPFLDESIPYEPEMVPNEDVPPESPKGGLFDP